MNPNRNTKPGWEIRLKGQVKKLWQQANVLKKKKHMLRWRDENKTEHKPDNATWLYINQKILAKEERLKRYQERVKQYKQNMTSKITKEDSTNK